MAAIRHDNAVRWQEHERSYHGICDLCVEALSDSDQDEIDRDIKIKKSEELALDEVYRGYVLLRYQAAEKRTKQEQKRAQRAQRRIREERHRAEAEQQRAEAEQQRAEAEQQRAEAERQRAEEALQRATAERRRAERYAALLREQGIEWDE